MERWRAVVPIIVALLIAVVASVLIYNYIKKLKSLDLTI